MSENPQERIVNPSDDALVVADALLAVAESLEKGFQLMARIMQQDISGDPSDARLDMDGKPY